MAPKKNKSRFENAIFSKLDSSLARVKEELEEMDAAIIDISLLKGNVEAVLQEMYSEIDSEAEKKNGTGALMVLGLDENTSPAPLARSSVIYSLRKVLREQSDALKLLEEAEDKKLKNWAKKATGKDNVRVDFDKLIIKKFWNETLYQGLDLSWLVIKEDVNKLRKFVDNIDANTNDGKKAFIRDLGAARLADKKIDELFQDLWNADNAKTIDEVLKSVLKHEMVKAHSNPIQYFAKLLKEKLELPAEEQQELMAEIMEE